MNYTLSINNGAACVSFRSKDTAMRVYVALYSAHRNGLNPESSAALYLDDNGFETLIDSFGPVLNLADAFAK